MKQAQRHMQSKGIKIVSLTLAKSEPNKSGDRIIANFDVETEQLKIFGCCLVRTRKNGIATWWPKIPGPNRHRLVHIKDGTLANAITLAAREAYRTMGGTEAEWTPRSVDEAEPEESEDMRVETTAALERILPTSYRE